MTDDPQMPRVFADFQNGDQKGRVRLNTAGTLHDLNRLGLVLREGAHILPYCLELETEAIVAYSTEENLRVGQVDWNNVQNRPEIRAPKLGSLEIAPPPIGLIAY